VRTPGSIETVLWKDRAVEDTVAAGGLLIALGLGLTHNVQKHTPLAVHLHPHRRIHTLRRALLLRPERLEELGHFAAGFVPVARVDLHALPLVLARPKAKLLHHGLLAALLLLLVLGQPSGYGFPKVALGVVAQLRGHGEDQGELVLSLQLAGHLHHGLLPPALVPLATLPGLDHTARRLLDASHHFLVLVGSSARQRQAALHSAVQRDADVV